MIESSKLIKKLADVYSPSAPINSQSLFYGRKDKLNRIHEAVREKGLHIVLYGERGVGKTSLANIVEKQYRGAVTAKITCNSESTLAGIWTSAFRKIPINASVKRKIGFSSEEKQEEFVQRVTRIYDHIPEYKDLSVDDIGSYLDLIKEEGPNILLIFDEFDQLSDDRTLRSFSNVIKYVSDNISNVTIMVVGIGKSIGDLIREHHSVERCLKQVPLERMKDEELSEIVLNATSNLEMSISEQALAKIVEYSSGFPHYTHLLGKYTTKRAIERHNDKISIRHFNRAMSEAIENANESLRQTFEKAVLSNREEALFEPVLFACALVAPDEHGTFRATDLEEVLQKRLGMNKPIHAFQYHLGRLCEEERGQVLERIAVGGSRTRYRFRNPLFRAFVRLKHYMKEGHR